MASVDGVSAQVRRIAILVTSLDAAAGRQLLAAMPSSLARDVRKAMASLTSIDPEERRRVLAEFHSRAFSAAASNPSPSTTFGSHSNALPISAPERQFASVVGHAEGAAVDVANHQAQTPSDPSAAGRDSTVRPDESGDSGRAAWQRFDVPTLTDLLRGERATVIAVVLSQLQPQQAVALLEQLPRPQHRSIIENLSRLGEIDPEAMQAIDEHLAGRIADYSHRRASQTSSVARMQCLLAAASPELRGQWQDIISQTDQQLAGRLGLPAAVPNSLARKLDKPSVAVHMASTPGSAGPAAQSLAEIFGSHVVTTADTPLIPPPAETLVDDQPYVIPFQNASLASAQRGDGTRGSQSTGRAASGEAAVTKAAQGAIQTIDEILELPPHEIAQVLAAADGEVILLALAGASPSFMQRFTPLLERSDARALRAQLKRLGAINLRDIDEAQRQLCELASQVVRANRPRQAIDSAIHAAA